MKRKQSQLSLTDEVYKPLVEQVFNHWKTVLNHPHSRLDPQRFRIIAGLLEIGYEVDTLLLAIEGVAVDPWEDRRYHDSIQIVFRSENLDKFIGMGEEARQWAEVEFDKLRRAKEVREQQTTSVKAVMPDDIRSTLLKFKAKTRAA